MRTTKLSLLRSRIRRQLMQLRRAQCQNEAGRKRQLSSLRTLLSAVQGSADTAHTVIQDRVNPAAARARCHDAVKRKCQYGGETEPACTGTAMPYTNHCIKRILLYLIIKYRCICYGATISELF